MLSRRDDTFEDLGDTLAELTGDHELTPSAWRAVLAMEASLGIELGGPDDSVTMLWRRYARVHRHVHGCPTHDARRHAATETATDLLAALRLGRPTGRRDERS